MDSALVTFIDAAYGAGYQEEIVWKAANGQPQNFNVPKAINKYNN